MRKITIEIIIVFFLWINIIASLISIMEFDITLSLAGILLSAVTIMLVLEKKDAGLLMLIFILLIGAFNGISFYRPFRIYIGVINLLPTALLFGLVYYRRLELLDIKNDWFTIDSIEMENSKLNRVNLFKREFNNLSSEELIRKLNNDKLVEEAKIAITQILKERNVTMNNIIN